MTKNPLYNAIGALVYIVIVVFAMNAISGVERDINMYIMPVMVVSLLTLSVAVMGYIFFYQPILLYLDGQKEKAISLFVKTTIIFGLFTFSTILAYFLFIK